MFNDCLNRVRELCLESPAGVFLPLKGKTMPGGTVPSYHIHTGYTTCCSLSGKKWCVKGGLIGKILLKGPFFTNLTELITFLRFLSTSFSDNFLSGSVFQVYTICPVTNYSTQSQGTLLTRHQVGTPCFGHIFFGAHQSGLVKVNFEAAFPSLPWSKTICI